MEGKPQHKKMRFNAAWSMAVGGMVGGGIFSVLGVVIAIAGQWAWLAFVIAGLIALATGFAYSSLVAHYGEGGGAFRFLRKVQQHGLAGSLSWVLILGYTLTISVYAFTFGHYLGHVVGLGAWFPRVCAVTIVAALAVVNLLGVGEAAWLEIVTVWGKLIVLIGLAAIGLWRWHPDALAQGVAHKSVWSAAIAAAAIFMAYEGFQLLSYDYEDMDNPRKLMPRATAWAIVIVIVVYVAVALGSAMLVGAGTIVAKKEVAIAVAGKKALGAFGLWATTVAAVFSTASAINATLFATARLTRDVADDDELPDFLGHENKKGVPSRAVLAIAGLGALLGVIGSLESLVEAASLVFLFTFALVNVLAYAKGVRQRWAHAVGAAGAAIAALLLCWRLLHRAPVSLAILAAVVLLAAVGRPLILRKVGASSHDGD